MNYHIPSNIEEITALSKKPLDEETIAAAIAGVIKIARSQGQSLEQLTAEVLQDDNLLDKRQRFCLSEIVSQAWQALPEVI